MHVVLLVDEIVRHMPTSHPQYTSLASALEHLRDVATHINEQKRIMDSMELALKVQERLTGDTPPPLVEAHRFVIREGLVLLQRPFTGKQSKEKREFTKYHFFLFNDLLLWTNPPSTPFATLIQRDKSEKLVCKGWLPLKHAFVAIIDDEPPSLVNAVEITSRGRKITLSFTSLDEKASWTKDLTNSIAHTITSLHEPAPSFDVRSIVQPDLLDTTNHYHHHHHGPSTPVPDRKERFSERIGSYFGI